MTQIQTAGVSVLFSVLLSGFFWYDIEKEVVVTDHRSFRGWEWKWHM
jgi:hypothetical protein